MLKSRMKSPGACVLTGVSENGGPIILAAGSDEAVSSGFDANSLIKELGSCIKGGGGGKATLAQAGGKDASGVDDVIKKAKELLA